MYQGLAEWAGFHTASWRGAASVRSFVARVFVFVKGRARRAAADEPARVFALLYIVYFLADERIRLFVLRI